MTVEDVDKIDFVNIGVGDVLLTISDHLDLGANEGEHLSVLQDKLNTYLEIIESGQLYAKFPRAIARKVVIQVVGKFPLSEEASKFFYRLAEEAIEELGYSVRFKQHGNDYCL
jgi:hypothetical protein